MTTTGWNENFERRARHTPTASRLAIATSHSESDVRTLTDLLSELHDVLEEYAPAWYDEDLHHRIEAALHFASSR